MKGKWQQISNEAILGAFAKFQKATISCVVSMSVCPTTWNNYAHTGRIVMEFDI